MSRMLRSLKVSLQEVTAAVQKLSSEHMKRVQSTMPGQKALIIIYGKKLLAETDTDIDFYTLTRTFHR